MNTFTISYTDGTSLDTGTAQEIADIINERWPNAYVLQERLQSEITSVDDLGDLDGRALVWETEEEAEGDDCSHAVASIERNED